MTTSASASSEGLAFLLSISTSRAPVSGKERKKLRKEIAERTGTLDINVGLVELVNELGQGGEVAVHCASGTVSHNFIPTAAEQAPRLFERQGRKKDRRQRTLEVSTDKELASHGCCVCWSLRKWLACRGKGKTMGSVEVVEAGVQG